MRTPKTPDVTPPKNKTRHHYYVAHVVLRQLALNNPREFFAVMTSPLRQEFLDKMWNQICQDCDQDGTASFNSRDIQVHITQVGEFPAVLIEMPKPYFTTEAFMVCAVLKVPITELSAIPENPGCQYFTLEKSGDMSNRQDKTVLCEWNAEAHIHYDGDGPEATQEAFVERIKEIIRPV